MVVGERRSREIRAPPLFRSRGVGPCRRSGKVGAFCVTMSPRLCVVCAWNIDKEGIFISQHDNRFLLTSLSRLSAEKFKSTHDSVKTTN